MPATVVPRCDGAPLRALAFLERSWRAVSEHALRATTGSPSFRGFYAFLDEADPNRAVSLTRFDTREDAMRSHEQVIGIMRERLGGMAYRPPRATMGETVPLATA